MTARIKRRKATRKATRKEFMVPIRMTAEQKETRGAAAEHRDTALRYLLSRLC